MRRAEGTKDVAPIVCLNPRLGLWRVRLAITPTETGAEWYEQDFDHRPTSDEIRALFVELVNEKVQQSILTGFTYEGKSVWLSEENQLNFRSTPTVPVRFKLGEDEEGNALYHTFTSAEELTTFNKAISDHIAKCLNEGWTEKDGFDVEPYLRE
ncbi:MAG: hypothetical protein IJ760_04195 [Bacteroidales bacterium]|nr:hypothetical protein [Bacteroidales bacterium]